MPNNNISKHDVTTLDLSKYYHELSATILHLFIHYPLECIKIGLLGRRRFNQNFIC